MFSNIFKVTEYLTITLMEKPSYLEANLIFRAPFLVYNVLKKFNFFGEHVRTAQRALVVQGVVAGNHCTSFPQPFSCGRSIFYARELKERTL